MLSDKCLTHNVAITFLLIYLFCYNTSSLRTGLKLVPDSGPLCLLFPCQHTRPHTSCSSLPRFIISSAKKQPFPEKPSLQAYLKTSFIPGPYPLPQPYFPLWHLSLLNIVAYLYLLTISQWKASSKTEEAFQPGVLSCPWYLQ
jgi:hypothetical protein